MPHTSYAFLKTALETRFHILEMAKVTAMFGSGLYGCTQAGVAGSPCTDARLSGVRALELDARGISKAPRCLSIAPSLPPAVPGVW